MSGVCRKSGAHKGRGTHKGRPYGWLILALWTAGVSAAGVPSAALRHRAELTRNARAVWGLDAPVATFAAQIHQESGWRSDAKSAFASGLAQFTPETASWISGVYPKELGENQPYNPSWAMRALVVYDKRLVGRADGETACDAMAKGLWGYNGGEGWVRRDEKLALRHGANIRKWREVEPFNAGRATAMFAENRGYPKMILLKWQPLYVASGWGRGVTCV